MSWWRDAVIYQVYPYSFQDSDGDGFGDLRGVISRLDDLAWLGVDTLWLNPTFPSPNKDWGYDVADFEDVHPLLGRMEDLDRLIAEGERRGMRVLLDLVPNHTSDQHPWFQDALTGRDARHRDWYVWADPKPDGSPPNNWISVAGGSAWTLDEASGQYYLHNFLPGQPDLNWWNEEVRDEFDSILRFWFERGVAGFRIDVCHAIIKDAELRDNPPATAEDHPRIRRHGQRSVYNMNRPEGHDIIKRWRKIATAYEPEPVLLGETWVLDLDEMARFYGNGVDELTMAFNFVFMLADFDDLPPIVARTDELLEGEAWPVWAASNHDVSRFPTRWCGGDEQSARIALMMFLTLRGTPVIYYGDELLLTDTQVPDDRLRDDMGKPGTVHYPGRDGARTPMPWNAEPGAGFTGPGVTPWLPLGDIRERNVAAQKADPASPLHLCRDLLALRRASQDLRQGAYEQLEAPEGVWLYRRGEKTLVALNLSGSDVRLPLGTADIALTSRPHGVTEQSPEGMTLGPLAGVVLSER